MIFSVFNPSPGTICDLAPSLSVLPPLITTGWVFRKNALLWMYYNHYLPSWNSPLLFLYMAIPPWTSTFTVVLPSSSESSTIAQVVSVVPLMRFHSTWSTVLHGNTLLNFDLHDKASSRKQGLILGTWASNWVTETYLPINESNLITGIFDVFF